MNQDNTLTTPPTSPTQQRARDIRNAIEGGQLPPMRARGFAESDAAYANRVNERARYINSLIDQQLAGPACALGDAAPAPIASAVVPNF